MIDGACSRAMTNNSRTIREPSPMNFWTNSEPLTRMNVQSVASNNSGCFTGNSITSLISLICLSNPPTISYVESGTFSTIISETSGSTLLGNILCNVYESFRNATRLFGVTSLISIFLSISTTNLPSG
ncbi:hypothetical protein DERP_008666 [Dermatophagoides pteronyssinus]|uniref:Uncharacterized protein n=1 Tax=Dermatophagoides pteronyssinus TaxID=6956 RepID=A0ABQ8IXJ6_DERPT|nr:hypothetical protein DERP_008666 [Dermatophagoides pteronyssinus]